MQNTTIGNGNFNFSGKNLFSSSGTHDVALKPFRIYVFGNLDKRLCIPLPIRAGVVWRFHLIEQEWFDVPLLSVAGHRSCRRATRLVLLRTRWKQTGFRKRQMLGNNSQNPAYTDATTRVFWRKISTVHFNKNVRPESCEGRKTKPVKFFPRRYAKHQIDRLPSRRGKVNSPFR